jgi:hypothetical protein
MLGILAATACLSLSLASARGDDKDAAPILDKAIAALGGEAKLAKATTFSWKAEGIISINADDASMKTKGTFSGIDRQRSEFALEINGMPISGVTVIDRGKGWRKFGEAVQDLEPEMLAATKQTAYLWVVSRTVLPLKAAPFKTEAAPDEMVDGKPAAVVKATGPDGKPFTLYFDKATGLPVKMTATVKGFQGDDVQDETMFADYKDFGGIQRATKVTSKRDGNPFSKMTFSDFEVIDSPPASTFAEPN